MTGKTHVKAGVLIYIILTILPLCAAAPFAGKLSLTIYTFIGVMIGCVWPDGDTPKSKMNRYNPITRLATTPVKLISKIGINFVKFMLSFGIGVMLIVNGEFVAQITQLSGTTVYIIGGVFILLYFVKAKYFKVIPFVGWIYKLIISAIRAIADKINYIIIRLVYIGIGAAIAVYNCFNQNNIIIYLIAIFIGLTAVFPHRTFLHSIEGIILFSISAVYFGSYIKMPEVGYAAVIGYISHIFMGDLFTNSGIVIFSFPYLLNKVSFVKRNKKLSKILRRLTVRIRIPLMKTYTKRGYWVEKLYIAVLAIFAILAYLYPFNLTIKR